MPVLESICQILTKWTNKKALKIRVGLFLFVCLGRSSHSKKSSILQEGEDEGPGGKENGYPQNDQRNKLERSPGRVGAWHQIELI